MLGDEVRQAGSLVTPDRLRFDYKTRRAPTPAELRQIEDLANRRIVENHPVRPFVTTREYAAEIGALAFFEEKYGEFVRVLEIDEFSRELCGGTHVSSTSQIGLCKITASTSVGANTRRVEAITSAAAIEYYRGVEAREVELAGELGVSSDRVADAVRRRLAETEELRQAASAVETGERRGRVEELLAAALAVGDATLVAGEVDVQRPDELLVLADEIRARQPDAAVALLCVFDGRVAVVVAASDALVGRGLRANEILAAMMPAIDGRGGGKPTLARGGRYERRRHECRARGGHRQGPGAPRRLTVRLLALDYGVARTGVAISDETGSIARPLTVVGARRHGAGLSRLSESSCHRGGVAGRGRTARVARRRRTRPGARGTLVRGASAPRDRRAGRSVRRALHDGDRPAAGGSGAARRPGGGADPRRLPERDVSFGYDDKTAQSRSASPDGEARLSRGERQGRRRGRSSRSPGGRPPPALRVLAVAVVVLLVVALGVGLYLKSYF